MAVSDSPGGVLVRGVDMTNEERETEIGRVQRLMNDAYLRDDLDEARAWARNFAELIRGRSAEVVEQMEKELGLR